MEPVLVFLHGWAFDAALFDRLAPLLPGADPVVADFGYFGEVVPPVIPRTDAPAVIPRTAPPVVAIAHSFGALWLLHEKPFAFDALVAINGFPRFTEAADFRPAVSSRVVDRMIQRFDLEPQAVLRDFRLRCGADGALPGEPRLERLRAGLVGLRDWDGRAGLDDVPVLALAGSADPIVPPAMSEAAFAAPEMHPSAGHLLPLSDPEWCAGHIRGFLGRIAES